MSEWLELPGYDRLVRRSKRNMGREPVDYRKFFLLVRRRRRRRVLVMGRTRRTVTQASNAPLTGQATNASRNRRGLKRSCSYDEAYRRREVARQKLFLETLMHVPSEVEKRVAQNSGNNEEMNASARIKNGHIRVEEGDSNIEASGSGTSRPLSRESTYVAPHENRRFPATPRHRDSFDSDDLSEDRDEQNIFKNCAQVAPESSGRMKTVQVMVRTTTEYIEGPATNTQENPHSTTPHQPCLASLEQMTDPQTPLMQQDIYPWQKTNSQCYATPVLDAVPAQHDTQPSNTAENKRGSSPPTRSSHFTQQPFENPTNLATPTVPTTAASSSNLFPSLLGLLSNSDNDLLLDYIARIAEEKSRRVPSGQGRSAAEDTLFRVYKTIEKYRTPVKPQHKESANVRSSFLQSSDQQEKSLLNENPEAYLTDDSDEPSSSQKCNRVPAPRKSENQKYY